MPYTQVYKTENVLEAAQRRIRFIFDNFKTIHVSVSGGKDSVVLASLALEEAKLRGRKIGIFFLDEEVVYQSTINMVEYIIEDIAPDNVYPLWLQLEFNLTNATSTTETQFKPWEAGKHKIWMRPKKDYSIKFPPWDKKTQTISDKRKGFGFYDVFANFEGCYENTASLVGLRGTESPNRWATVSNNPVSINGEDVFWGTKRIKGNVNLYPIYDWNLHDVWHYIWSAKLKYHRVYDYQFKLGTPLNDMRISSLIHEKSFKALCDLPSFEPKTYSKLLKRAKGIAMAQETGKNRKLFKARKLPKNFNSWIMYRDFLLETHADPRGKEILSNRFKKHLNNEYVARQQVRQLILNDYENNIVIRNKLDPRDELIEYYSKCL